MLRNYISILLHNVSNFDVQIFRFSKLLSNGLLSSVCFMQGTNHPRSQEIGFENSTHRTFILFRRWPVQQKALSCMLMLSQALHLLLMCCICRYLLLYITFAAPHITLLLLLISSLLTSIFPAPPPPVHPSECCHGRGASMLLPDAAIKALHLTQADTS